MYVTDKWLRPIEKLLLIIKSRDYKIVGLTSTAHSDVVRKFSGALVTSLKLSKTNSILIDCTNEISENTSQEVWSYGQYYETDHSTQNAVVIDRLVANPSPNNRYEFTNTKSLREIFDSQLSDYDRVIVKLPEVIPPHPNLLNPLAAIEACDAVFVLCGKDSTTRTELKAAHDALSEINATVAGLILSETS